MLIGNNEKGKRTSSFRADNFRFLTVTARHSDELICRLTNAAAVSY